VKPEAIGAPTTPAEVEQYIKLPSKAQREFWNRERIQHIRDLASTGRPSYLWMEEGLTTRVLDRIQFKGIDKGESNLRAQNYTLEEILPYDTSVELAYGRIPLKTPLYLGDMSFGALSGIPNIALARAADITGVLTGTGEGGLNEEVRKCKRITVQWASARFGVDIDVLKTGMGIVIKIGQGAKPGIGGHLPGTKVTEPISVTRRIPVGKDAISPAPHHDIYSIEDLGQRIWALKEATGKPVFVKVGVTNYIPYIASGIARMGADGIIMDGQGAGTGAAPSIVKDHVGIPIELAVPAVDSILREQGMRKGFSVIAAGMVSNAEETAKLIALGADCVSIGTGSLIALGCLMVHKCHLGFCPALLTNKIVPNPAKVLSLTKAVEWLVNLIRGWDLELKMILKELGISNLRSLVGRRELLEGLRVNPETLDILGIDASPGGTWYGQGFTMPREESVVWSQLRRAQLQELAGTIGRTPGEAVISSMGTIYGPFVDEPGSICDWLRSDGAQVTRPSIDPYREPIETSIRLSSGIRLSMPIFFAPLPADSPPELHRIFLLAADSMGTVYAVGRNNLPDECEPFLESTLLDIEGLGEGRDAGAAWVINYVGMEDLRVRLGQLKGERPVYLRIPSSESMVPLIERLLDPKLSGIIIDWDMVSDDRIDLEIAISEIDRALAEVQFNGRPARYCFDLLAESSRVRGADEVYKMMGLGADAVGLSRSALVGIGYEQNSAMKFDYAKGELSLLNLLHGMQKEIKLLAGAAGVSSVQSTLVRNRELFRSVDLDPSIRHRLGIKAAGMG